jgi:hypothetical protein
MRSGLLQSGALQMPVMIVWPVGILLVLVMMWLTADVIGYINRSFRGK